MIKPTNIAVLGCSAIADKTVIPTILSSPYFKLSMVGSRSPEKGKIFAEKYNCRYGSYDDVLMNSDIDAVYLSLPSGLHYDWGKKVLEAGKNLLMEKPFTDTLVHAKELVDFAQEKNLVAMEGLAYVYHPYFDKLKQLVNDNVIGKVRLIESSFGFPHLNKADIRYNDEIGGGAILDNLIYPLSLSLGILGNNVIGQSYRIINNEEFGVDECGFVRLDWKDASANINYGFGFSYKNSFELWGTDGRITVDRAYTKPANADAEIVIHKNGTQQIVKVEATNQFACMLADFYNKVSGTNGSLKNEGADILDRMKFIGMLYDNRKNDE